MTGICILHRIRRLVSISKRRIHTERNDASGHQRSGCRADAQIRAAQHSLSYFEENVRKLEARKQQNQVSPALKLVPGGLPPSGG
ncbi:hypothetical protein Clacol_003257 [Clathrus columnatus]|uniref:Uncharacterized protein n=1 Tax=Clathrus columnatus TaxID=1419009 RepID=A0AAV5A7S5_9AGAM|nr:hypothetical protein Clacol_003257 [Clathrus columnatus]